MAAFVGERSSVNQHGIPDLLHECFIKFTTIFDIKSFVKQWCLVSVEVITQQGPDPCELHARPDAVITANFYSVSREFSTTDTPIRVSDDASQSRK